MTTSEIIDKITSRDTNKVWESACEIIKNGQFEDKIIPIIEYLDSIKEETLNLEMGGAFSPNQRFIDFAIRTIEFHRNRKKCTCNLYVEKFKLTNDIIEREIQYESFSPEKEEERKSVKILETVRIENKWVDYYILKCTKCSELFKVEEREGHYMFWNWSKLNN